MTISNTYFTPFTAEVTDAGMPCTVKRGAMTDMPYIYDGIIIECPETLAAEEKKTTVTITTSFGRTETIEVTQMPRGEFINLGMNGTEIAMEGCEDAPLITVFTNIVLSDIRVETDAPWLTAVLETTPRENARARFRSIEGKEVEPESRATVDYMLEGVVRLTAGPNTAAEAREATISLSYGSVEKSVKFTQAGAGTLPEFEDLTFDAKAQDSYISFNPGGFSRKIFFEVEESADWCRVTMDGIVSGEVMRVILTANESIEARTAKVTAYAFNEECGSFTVTQKGIEEISELFPDYSVLLGLTRTQVVARMEKEPDLNNEDQQSFFFYDNKGVKIVSAYYTDFVDHFDKVQSVATMFDDTLSEKEITEYLNKKYVYYPEYSTDEELVYIPAGHAMEILYRPADKMIMYFPVKDAAQVAPRAKLAQKLANKTKSIKR